MPDDISDDISDSIQRLFNSSTPYAVMMRGANPLAPNCPTRGIFGVSTWAVTTQHCSWKNEPEGWAALMEEEKVVGKAELGPFIVFWDGDKGFCLRLRDTECFQPLVLSPSEEDINETAEWISEEYCASY